MTGPSATREVTGADSGNTSCHVYDAKSEIGRERI